MKYQRTGCLKIGENHSLTALEVRSLKPKCWQGHLSLRAPRENPFRGSLLGSGVAGDA